ncbi:MAG: FAD/NAD(P)-binding protein [Candidatus Eremiobacteraeota bacterium]|nr:FAD/NAD(P)-binding protein [Candidatus Eremiobacteraeota bacterium]
MPETIGIVGGGASGVLAAAQLLARTEHRVVLIEPGELARGIAYSTTYASHLLNVPAAKMSALAEDSSHFLRWLETRFPGRYGVTSFVPRIIYGDYLTDIASRFFVDYPGRFVHVRDCAVDVKRDGDRLGIVCANGDTLSVDRCIVATGHAKVSRAGQHADLPQVFSSAWIDGALVPADADEPVAILGSGLTAIDAVLGLRGNGHRGGITLISTRGLLPHEHRLTDDPLDWRASVDDLRAVTNARWQAMSLVEQRRFLRHYASYWNAHRHRMAPQIAQEIGQLLAVGTLNVVAGRVRSIAAGAEGLSLTIRLRGSQTERMLDVARVIDCTGSDQDVRKTANPFLRSLLDRGLLTPHPVGVGSCVAGDGALIDRNGVASSRLFAIGPLRFGSFFETTAIPEIRAQAEQFAQSLSAERAADTEKWDGRESNPHALSSGKFSHHYSFRYRVRAFSANAFVGPDCAMTMSDRRNGRR